MASPLDPTRLRAYQVPDSRDRYDPRETILYALGTGAGLGDTDEHAFLFERDLVALPTMALVLGTPGFWLMDRALGIDWARVDLAGVALRLTRPLEIGGDVSGTTRIGAVMDDGADAVLHATRVLSEGGAGGVIATIDERWILRGAGGFGGEPVANGTALPLPAAAADGALDLPTARNQAALYRLTGDRNPLHIDAETARLAGHDRPVLHPAATMGLIARALIHLGCDGDARRLNAMETWFAAPVTPGDTIRTEMWRADAGELRFRAAVAGRVVAEGRAERDGFGAIAA